MNEIVVNFGPGGHLCGTLTLPDGKPRPVAVLLCNAGVIQRIGPHRINVKLARHLASQGFAVLRMDLSGQGDSQRSNSTLGFEEQAVADLRAGMDHVERLAGTRQFALAGICSGAHHGLSTALADARVAALWMLDGYAYPTPRTLRVRMARQLEIAPVETVSRWLMKPARGLVGALARPFNAGQADLPAGTGHPTPAKERFAESIGTLLQRGVHLQVVYTRSMFWQYNHESQWRDAFAEHGAVAAVACDYMPDMDHTVTSLASQRAMIASVVRWLDSMAQQPCTATAGSTSA